MHEYRAGIASPSSAVAIRPTTKTRCRGEQSPLRGSRRQVQTARRATPAKGAGALSVEARQPEYVL